MTRYRWPVLLAPFLLFTGFAALWVSGFHELYSDGIRAFGIRPFRFPFSDLQGVLAAAECWREGFPVLSYNPCDPLGRPHIYSPLWLFLPSGVTSESAPVLGVALALLFIASFAIIFRPRRWSETVLYLAAVLSPTVVFAVERANVDVVIFLLALLTAVLSRGREPQRALAYTAAMLAAFLKFYPITLGLLILREPLWRAAIYGAVGGIATLAFAITFQSELSVTLLHHMPGGGYVGEDFSAKNLPYGLPLLFPSIFQRLPVLSEILFAMLLAGCTIGAFGWARLLTARGAIDLDSAEMRASLIGAILVFGCFVAGRNIAYRGIFLLLALPSLHRIAADASSSKLRNGMRVVIAALVALIWYPSLDHLLDQARLHFLEHPTVWVDTAVSTWMLKELTWWALVSTLGGLVLAFLQASPAVGELRHRLYAGRRP